MAMPLLRPPPSCGAGALRTQGIFAPTFLHSTCVCRQPRQIRGPLTQQSRAKGSRSDAELRYHVAQQNKQEAAQRQPRKLRWAHPDRDEGINSRFVILLDPKTNVPTASKPLSQLLQRIDRAEEFVVRVGRSGEAEGSLPVCKIIPKKEAFERERKQQQSLVEAAKNRKRNEGKTVEIGWATAEGDLLYRFRKARGFLEAGARVNVLFENRRKRTIVPRDQAMVLLDKVKTAMLEVPKVVELDREGELGRRMKVVYGTKE